jgi:hypothetical protein
MKTDEFSVVIITIFLVVIVVESWLLVYFIYINTVRTPEISLIKTVEICMTCSFSSEVVPVNAQYKHVKERDHLEIRSQMCKNITVFSNKYDVGS